MIAVAGRFDGVLYNPMCEHNQSSRLRLLTLSTVYPNPDQPGKGRFVHERIRHMASGADITVLAPVPFFDYQRRHKTKRGVPDTQDGRLPILRPRWIYPPLIGGINPLWLFLRLIWPMRQLRRSFRYQVIDSHFAFPDGCAAALLAWLFRCPFTVTLRGSEVLHAKYPLRRYGMGAALRRADRVIAVSERLRQFAIGLGVKPEHVKTIPNGVDTTRFFVRDQTESRRQHGIPLDRKMILSAGHLIELKGHHRIIQALSGIRNQGTDAELVIAGGGGDVKSFEQEIHRTVSDCGLQQHVRFMGEVPQQTLAELMAAADVFCLASSREGWPNVVNESLACGLPVVATDVGAIPEMIASGQNGIVVPPGDVPALESALEEALHRDWDRAAIATWGQSRSWEQVAKDVLHEMDLILTENGLRDPVSQSSAQTY